MHQSFISQEKWADELTFSKSISLSSSTSWLHTVMSFLVFWVTVSTVKRLEFTSGNRDSKSKTWENIMVCPAPPCEPPPLTQINVSGQFPFLNLFYSNLISVISFLNKLKTQTQCWQKFHDSHLLFYSSAKGFDNWILDRELTPESTWH